MVVWLFDVSDNGGQLGILIGVYMTPNARKASVARPIEDHFGTRLVSQFQILPSSNHTSKTVCRSKDSAHTKEKVTRSEEHTSELQSLTNLVCRLLLEKKKTNMRT